MGEAQEGEGQYVRGRIKKFLVALDPSITLPHGMEERGREKKMSPTFHF
jgi:hypothetical protein